MEYIELTPDKDFRKDFIDAMVIPHMKDGFPHLEEIVPDEILNQK